MAKRKSRRFRRYIVSGYQKEALRHLLPPDDMTVSEWAAKYRVLDSKSSAMPGPWRNDKTPYLVGVMDAFCSYETEEIILVKATQLGGTEALFNMVGWVIQQDPSPSMIIYPSDTLAESISENRLQPMFRLSAPLKERWREHESSKTELQFDGMYLTLAGSNSPANLSSRPIRFLFMDEVDKYSGATKKEAGPIKLARERTKTFHNSKVFMTSTPTLKSGHIWQALEKADEERHFFVPCPHCGRMIELKWSQVTFPNEEGMSYMDRAELASYVCQECGCVITDQDKPQMLRFGEWRTVRKSAALTRTVGFWINTLYSPFVRFSEIAREFLASKDDPDTLQNFVNSWLAEPWEDTKLKTSAETVMERQTDVPELVVPSWAKLLTGGVDVQETCVYWSIRAWGNYLTSQNIAHGQALSFAEVETAMNLSYQKTDGTRMVVQLALIDSGDNTDAVYDFCAANSDWALPVKGSSHPMTTHFKISTINRTDSRAYGMKLVLIDTGKYKDMIAGRMKKDNGPGSWMVYRGCDMNYAEQVTAEHKVNVRSGGKTRQVWQLKTSHTDNHYLDTEVYNMCAADMLGARSLHLEEAEPKTEAKQAEQKPEAGSWLGTGGGPWLP